MKLGSAEYLLEVQRRSNADAAYLKAAKDENDSYTLVLEAEPQKGVPKGLAIGYSQSGGKITEIWEGERPTAFTLSGPYGVWVDILRGKLSANKAFTMRKLKVRGNFLKLLAGSEATIAWLKVLSSIPTEFEGDYAAMNMPGS
jgi:putative sterol carrier protein